MTASLPAEATADLGPYVKKFNRASVLVVGDAMLDRYVYGTVNRVSPEAPVPILTVTREVAMPGGAGNVVRNLIALDAAAAFVSVVGDDQAGSDLTGLVGGQERVEPWLLVHGGRTTTLKTRYIAQGQHLIRADREETIDLPPEARRAAGAHRAGCHGGDDRHRAVGLPQGRAERGGMRGADRGCQEARAARDRGPEGARLDPL